MTFQERLKKIASNINDVVYISKLEATQTIMAEMSSRIFNDGKDSKEQLIGTYSDRVKLRKLKEGKKADFVNLIDTTKLLRDVVAVEDKIEFSTKYGQEISEYNELNFEKEIFKASENEEKILVKILNENLKKLFNG